MWLKARIACWFDHVNATGAGLPVKHWLTDAGSMTRKLKARSNVFGVRHLAQKIGLCDKEECSVLGVPLRSRRIQREVVLLCDDQPVIYGYTSVVSAAMRRDWPFVPALGNVPLGAKLFTDRRVMRQPFQYTRLHPMHPLMQRAAKALDISAFTTPLYARRSVFTRQQGVMLVTEIFLPAMTHVMAIESE
jgi:chorismate--pyruvate lyase